MMFFDESSIVKLQHKTTQCKFGFICYLTKLLAISETAFVTKVAA